MRQKIKRFTQAIESMNPLLTNDPEIVCRPDAELQVCAVYFMQAGRRVSTRILITFAAITRAKSLDILAAMVCGWLRKR